MEKTEMYNVTLSQVKERENIFIQRADYNVQPQAQGHTKEREIMFIQN
jgi:hypothetical protein